MANGYVVNYHLLPNQNQQDPFLCRLLASDEINNHLCKFQSLLRTSKDRCSSSKSIEICISSENGWAVCVVGLRRAFLEKCYFITEKYIFNCTNINFCECSVFCSEERRWRIDSLFQRDDARPHATKGIQQISYSWEGIVLLMPRNLLVWLQLIIAFSDLSRTIYELTVLKTCW